MWWNMFWTEMATYEESESPELSPQHSLASVCQCLVSRSKECIFLHDQNSPVTKRRMASTAMRLQIDNPPAAAGWRKWDKCLAPAAGIRISAAGVG